MKKSNFVALVLGTIGVVFFALGMCMCLLPEWNLFREGVGSGIVGLLVLLVTVIVWRKMEGKAPVKLNKKSVVTALIGVLGALLFGVGMCMCMVFGKMVSGVIVGLAGIIVLMLLIPLAKGLYD